MSDIRIFDMDKLSAENLSIRKGPTAVIAADFLANWERIIGGRDSMEERRYLSGFVPANEIPDDVEMSVEDMAIARLDGDVEEDEEETIVVTAGFRTAEDDRVTVNGLDLDTYLEYVGEGGDYGLCCDDSPLTAEEMMQDELEAATPKSYAPTSKTVRRQAERFEKRATASNIAAREYRELAVREEGVAHFLCLRSPWEVIRHLDLAQTFHIWAWRNEDEYYRLQDLAATTAGKADIMAKGERSDARDRRLNERAAKRDRIRNAERAFAGELREQFLATPPEAEPDEYQRYEDEYVFEAEGAVYCSCCRHQDAAWFDWDNISVVLRQLRDTLSMFFGDEGAAFYATFGHGLDIAVHCWAAGMSDQETYNLLEQLVPLLIPEIAPQPADDDLDLDLGFTENDRKFLELLPPGALDHIKEGFGDEDDWDLDPPRQSGEFGRAAALLDDEFDDVPSDFAALARKRDAEDPEERERRRRVAN